MDSTEDLLRRIVLGEDSNLELKQVMLAGSKVKAPDRGDFADELSAFANTRGGTLLLGVDDKSKQVLGIPLAHLDAVEAWVREVSNDAIKPPLDAEIRKIELPDSTGVLVPIIRVDIARSLFIHKSPGGYFRRLGSSKREMAPELLARLFQERSQSRVIRFDESPVPGTKPSDLDSALVARFLRAGTPMSDSWLQKLRIVAKDDHAIHRLTVAGVLLCTKSPQNWLPHAYIQAVSYSRDRSDVNYQSDARDLMGPIDAQVTEALHFVKRNMSVQASKMTARSDLPQYSERAIFEALVNAVAHRDYSMAGSRIRLHMFRDRLELSVPGALANTLTPASMELRQYSRNELVVSLLARCPVGSAEEFGRAYLMDRRGDGVPIILSECKKLSGRAPEYSVIDESELRLVIWASTSESARDSVIASSQSSDEVGPED